MKRLTHTIDATNQVPGRLATRLATVLMGKHKVDYMPQGDNGDCVVVEHAALMKFDKKKLEHKLYRWHSGYPGGLKQVAQKMVSPQTVLRRAVFNMLPNNRLRAKRLKRLTIHA
ncbi:MAG: 50S ribosomal protein L13 [Candidatus Kerfeldbacteria bacterium]|nr:50S ribosomal protein L13 [Candidatus Kerfeldbacteria bacterium]